MAHLYEFFFPVVMTKEHGRLPVVALKPLYRRTFLVVRRNYSQHLSNFLYFMIFKQAFQYFSKVKN
jgi:hypothetical protein